jgi:hypothetical protein
MPKLKMSDRASAVAPRTCSGAMYAAVPRMMPACVMAGLIIVGELANALARPKSSTFTAVVADLDVGRRQVAMNDAALVRGFERLGDLPRDGRRVVEG